MEADSANPILIKKIMNDYLKKRLEEKIHGRERVEKKNYRIPKKSAKKIILEKIEKQNRGGEDTELLKWYKARQKQLTGRCMRCGAAYNHKDFKQAVAATAHLLAKRPTMFPSVATHPMNFLELGATCGCHDWYDNRASWAEIEADKIWPVVVERFLMVEPDIAPAERRRIPENLQKHAELPFLDKIGNGGEVV